MPRNALWLELSYFLKLLTYAALVAAALAGLALAAFSAWRLARPRLRPLRTWLRWQTHHRAAHRFAVEVAAGHLDDADSAAARALGGPSRYRRAQHQTPASWDERIVLTGPDSAPASTDPQDPAWCSAVHQPQPPDTDLRVGRFRPIRLRLLSWDPVETGGVRLVADAQGTVLAGHLLVRPAPHGTDTIEIWVHLEGPPTRRGRRALRVTRRATRSRLHALGAHHTPSPRRHHRRWPRRSQHGKHA